MLRQWAFGLKSDPNATMTPWSIIALTGGLGSLKMYAVVGRMTATLPLSDMAVIPEGEISSRWEMASAPIAAPIWKGRKKEEVGTI